jgi:tRNA(fMet)-specific endonuclease VapC
MRFLLDTNTCIGILTDRSPRLTARWRTMHASQIRLCSVVKAELLFGAEKSTKKPRVVQELTLFFARFRSMPFDDEAARRYGVIRADLEAKGTPIGPNDLLIAAIALASDLTLVTHNAGEFSRVPGLRLEDWEG